MICTRSKFGSVKIKRIPLFDDRVFIGIDSGISLTKVVYKERENMNQVKGVSDEYVILNYCLFNNEDFENTIQWIKGQAYIPYDCYYVVHITGSCGFNKKAIVESILGLKTEYINEHLSLVAGLRIGLEEIGFDNLVAPDVEVVYLGDVKSVSIDRSLKNITRKLTDDVSRDIVSNSVIYPCLIQVCGSLSKFVYFNKNGKGEVIRCQSIGAQTMLGLGKCLFDVNNYDEIMELAKKGNRANVDTQIKDIFSELKDSPYGKYPLETALFPFGKCMDFDRGLEDYRTEDLAASLVAFYCIMIIMDYFHVCTMKKIHKVYLTGNIFRCDTFQREIKSFLVLLPPAFEMKMLDFGYARALGAIFCENDDTEEYFVTKPS